MEDKPKLDHQLRARDFVPGYGIISYVRRNVEDLGTMEISLRGATLTWYNLSLAAGLTLATLKGLEKLMQ